MKKVVPILALGLGLGLSPASSYAYSSGQVILRATKREAPVNATGARYVFHPLSKIEFGYGIPEFGHKKFEYSLKVQPKGIFESIEYARYANSLNRGAVTVERTVFSRRQREAYGLLVNAVLAKEQLILSTESRRLLERVQKFSAVEAASSQLDVKSVLRAGNEWDKLRLSTAELEDSVTHLTARFRELELNLNDLDTGDIIGPEEIYQVVSKLPEAGETLSAVKIRSDLDMAERGVRFDEARRSKLLDGVKVTVEEEEKKRDKWGAEFTISLPFLAARDLGEQRDRIKLLEARAEADEKLAEVSDLRLRLINSLKSKIETYRYFEQAEKVEKAASEVKHRDATFLLDLRKTMLQRKITMAQLLAEIRSLYLDLLLESGTLVDEPGVNHLSKRKEGLG